MSVGQAEACPTLPTAWRAAVSAPAVVGAAEFAAPEAASAAAAPEWSERAATALAPA